MAIRDRINALRGKDAAGGGKPVPGPDPETQPTAEGKPVRGPVPAPGTEGRGGRKPGVPVTYSCGHAESIASITGKPCPSCRNATRKAKAERNRLKKQGWRKAAGTYLERLPDKARFEVAYNARDQQWSGTLEAGGRTFVAVAGGVFHLLASLDSLYREALKGDAPPA